MIREVNDNDARRAAFSNVVGAIELDRFLPENVFSGEWSDFLFFQSDRMFVSAFAEVVGELLSAENAEICCLLNLSETDPMEFEKASAFLLDGMVPGNDYEAHLRGSGPAVGWLYSMDRYGCASDVGDWCIYCEKENDIAVVALRKENGVSKFRSPLDKLRAQPIEALSNGELATLFPFSNLTAEWRIALTKRYRSR